MSDAALAAVFDDHARIEALGLHSVVNVSLLMKGSCAATMSVLGSQEKWLPCEVTLICLLAVLATPWVLSGSKAYLRADSRCWNLKFDADLACNNTSCSFPKGIGKIART